MQPEHFDLSTPLFLPITEETCAGLLERSQEALDVLTDPELAAMLVIQNLVQVTEKDLTPTAVERILVKLLDWAADAPSLTKSKLLPEAKRLFDRRKLYFGIETIKKSKLRFLLADEVIAQKYLLPSGRWDVDYKYRHVRYHHPFQRQMVTTCHDEHWLSGAQDHLVRTFRANLDEHLHVQGYAGIGKSHLMGALVECLQPKTTLVLAHTEEKLATLRKRMKNNSSEPTCSTFRKFASVLLQRRIVHPVNEGRGPSKQMLAQQLNIVGLGSHDIQATMDICLRMVELYCRSRDYTLSTKHMPALHKLLSKADAMVLLEYSSRLWTYIQANPEWGRRTGFEVLLMIKYASLEGCVVSPRYSHVLIDESQDVPASLLQILERGRQVLVTLGDEYQHAESDVVARGQSVRQSTIGFSVRSGRNIERLVNPLISRHSRKTKEPFEGARHADVCIEEYPEAFVPPEECVVLTASLWDTMKWVIQLRDLRCPFSFYSSQEQKGLWRFMTTAIGLFNPRFHQLGEEAAHPYFNEWTHWQQVREANQYDDSFLWVEAELEKGFKVADVTQMSTLVGQPGKSCMLMRAEEAGGMEFDYVLLTPGLLTTSMFKDAYEFDRRICAVYIAISRAKRRLYVPYKVHDWIVHHDTQKFCEVFAR
ncbi:hypothetical protein ACNT2N_24015 [Pseudomonas thivervalensis]|uniref:Uncharacterized protein n=1 Tax=Pseudomonas thivervalensis TaxID=86265 RepID=A0A2Z4Z4Z0_9PSED|nr:hypothetical protein [Pseudomonas thivervalensis]AXA52902.1 hypothetical protein CE140_00540 [Pseudomonas thivervalensis]AXA58620.1 hypothetical protein CEQ51_00540 [Pseudomonas thivervalensis]